VMGAAMAIWSVEVVATIMKGILLGSPFLGL